MTKLLCSGKRRPLPLSTLALVGMLCSSLLFSFMLSACGGDGANGKIHLTIWYWNRSIDDKLLAQVSKQFPNVVLIPEKITDYDNKVRTAMAGHKGVPDIIAINSNIATYFPDEDQFVDLNTLGAEEIKSEYLPWKWNLGTTPDHRQIAIPMDTGPTALFYRADIFAKAGLPTDPQAVSERFKTWDEYLQAAPKIAEATQNKSFLFDDIYNVYEMQLMANKEHYFTPSGQYIGDQPEIRRFWNMAVQAGQAEGGTARAVEDWNQAMNNGRAVSFVGAVWNKQILADAAPDTAGKWRIARAPGGDGNYGGSFLTISKNCEHPKEAFEVIKWLQSPENQLFAYKDIQLFPSAIRALDDPSLNQPESFFGGQRTTQIFAAAAKNVPLFYTGPNDTKTDNFIYQELENIQLNHKNPDQAWQDAQRSIQRNIQLS
ncbi:extracellular solute-binding protein [Ktedonosporobacter rubrisoli]|uniref:Extracellular solute-binding protein n=1 Tax=Ktedonosporobacter rubrisoli TaxID=2509675 RepID=A0A4P6JQS7_KTERU|nr:extracellular solute-binding protein [Ktedonosporobacter rubrisoli]QBD77512.1 extracellular solute-binding protein [Ktedonosporobacter rubrisoli]